MEGMRAWLVLSAALALGCASRPRLRSAPPVAVPRAALPERAIARGPAPRPAAPPMAGDIGTAHPILLDHAASDGRWLVVCQARADTNKDGEIAVGLGMHGDTYGDRMLPYLITAPGPGDPIDAFVAATDRYVAVIQHGLLVLVDTLTGTRVALPRADPRDDPSPFGPHRAASFDAGGKRLLYILRDKPGVVVRDLASGREATLGVGDGNPWRASLDGAFVVLRVVGARWPSPVTWLAGRSCRAAVGSYGVMGMRGDRPVPRVAPLDGGPVRDVPDLIRPLGDALLRRLASGALVLEEPDGELDEIATAGCHGTVVNADAAARRVLVACRSKGDRSRLEIDGPGLHRDLGVEVDTDGDAWSVHPQRLVIEAGGTTVVDMRGARARTFPFDFDHEGGRLLATSGKRVLVRRGTWLSVGDLDVPTELPLGVEGPQYPEYFSSGAFAYSQPYVVDLQAARVVGEVDEPVLAIASNGYVLAPPRQPGGRRLIGIPTGPVAWRWP